MMPMEVRVIILAIAIAGYSVIAYGVFYCFREMWRHTRKGS